MVGKVISHYKILEKLGEGGMGVVYKAEDMKLKREVAIKFLPERVADDASAYERFKIEAQAAAALNHPNIATIYSIEEEDDKTFIVMEYVKGKSLKEKIDAGKVDITEALDIAIQISQGLAKAHEKGITHRDIKPSNIVVSDDGVAKILDFGLAKIAEGTIVTKKGTTLGTAAYMSPEQARGESVDHRTDIWSLGVIIYEMLTGQRPFKGEYEQAVIYSILNTDPEPMTDMPENVESIVYKALNKNVSERYQKVSDLKTDLNKAKKEIEIKVSKTETKEEKSIVVLPFVNMSPDPEQEYFSDGLTEEIITDLSHIHDLLVISRNSAMTFKGTEKKTKEIAKEVNVRYVLEGSVRKAGNNLRITAQLIDAKTDAHLWADKYSGTLDDVFDIQEKVSRSIVDALKLKLSPEEEKKIEERPIDNVQAYECYLRARQEIWRWTEDAFDRALQYLKNGLDIIGENSLLYAGLGYVCWNYVNLGVKKEDYIEKAEEYVRKAFELDPDCQKGHVVLGVIYHTDRATLKESIHHLKQALVVDPDDTDALFWLALVYDMCLGKIFAAIPLVERFFQIDPLNPNSSFTLGLTYFFEGRYDLALEPLRKAYQMEHENPVFQIFYALGLIHNKYYEEGFSIIDQSEKTTPEVGFVKLGIFLKYALQRKKTEALQLLSKESLIWARRDYLYSLQVAEGYSLINQKDNAFDWLENAIDRGNINYPYLNEYDPWLENIRGEERFKKLMEKVKYEWENFEV